MRFSCVLFLCGFLVGQTPVAQKHELPDDAVVATVDGKQYTAAEVRALMNSVPPQYRQSAMADMKNALQQVLMQRYLAAEAKKEGLENESPYKEQIEFFLAQSMINDHNNRIIIGPDEAQQYYKAHSADYEQAKVRMIQIAFSSGQVKSDKKVLTEAEAKAKVERLRKELAGGADFAQLAKENSDDRESAEKGGEWGVIKRTSKLPDDVKNAIFSLKPGQVSEPLRQPNGFYLVKVDEVTVQPFNEVAAAINDAIRRQRLDEWMQTIQKRFTPKVENPDFFESKPTPAGSR